jgi:dihydrofolate reductase
VIQQYRNAGLVDKFYIALAHVFFNAGRCLREKIDWRRVNL